MLSLALFVAQCRVGIVVVLGSQKREGKAGGPAHARASKKKASRPRAFFFYMCIQYHTPSGTPSSRAGRRHHKAVVRPIFFLFAGKHPWDISSLFSLSFYRYDHSVCVTCASRRPAEKKGEKTHPERGAHARTTPGISGFPIASPAQVSPGRSNGFREDFVMSEISSREWRRRRRQTAEDRRRTRDGADGRRERWQRLKRSRRGMRARGRRRTRVGRRPTRERGRMPLM